MTNAAATSVPREDVAGKIQSTILDVSVTRDEIVKHCETCDELGFNAAMIPGRWVRVASEVLADSDVIVASVVDFPLGAMTVTGKTAEACSLVAGGARELDLGMPIGLVKEGELSRLERDLRAIVDAVEGVPVKAMLELPLLEPAERDAIVDVCVDAGIAYLKNASSGAVGIATPEEMSYLRERAPEHVRVKASGGIKSYDQVVALLEAGADLVGTSAGVAIVSGGEDSSAVY